MSASTNDDPVSDWLAAATGPRRPACAAGLDALLGYWESLSCPPFERAVRAGLASDRLGLAFAGGYRSALLALTGESSHAAVCITEEGGAHPRAILTTLEIRGDAAVVRGAKRWSTLAGSAQTLLIAASQGREGDRNALRMVRVPVDADGLTLRPMPATPFAPEIPHFRIELDDVTVPTSAILPGDGYTQWIKPFRTVEDIHVVAAAAAYVVGLARDTRWPAAAIAQGIAVLATLSDLAVRPPLDPAVHLGLGGALALFDAWLRQHDENFGRADTQVRDRWVRDRGILGVAGRVRSARLARAAVQLGLDA